MSEHEQLKDVAKRVVRAAGRSAGVGGLGVAIFDDHQTWDPVVPADIHAKLPAIADDGTASCWMCQTRLPFAQLEIAGDAYACRACLARQHAAAPVGDVKLATSWWIIPAIALVIAGIVTAMFVLR